MYTVQIGTTQQPVQFEPVQVRSDVRTRIAEYNVTLTTSDPELARAQLRAEHRIVTFINRAEIPEGLYLSLIDEIAADLIAANAASVELDADGNIVDGSGALKEIKEGDVSYSFDVQSAKDAVTKLTAIEAELRKERETWYHYRTLAW